MFLVETFLLWLANLQIRFRRLDFMRWRLLKLAGVRISKCEFRSPFNFTQFGRLGSISIGEDTFVNVNLRIGVGQGATVSIGRDCAIGPNVSFETMGHDLVWKPNTGWGGTPKSIIVGDRCWIGAGVIVLGGVSIGEGCVVAAGAVVNKDVMPFTLVGGVPAKEIRSLKLNHP